MYIIFIWQDIQTTWNTTDPDFSPCFQKTVLLWIPCAFLVVIAPAYIAHLRKSQNAAIPISFFSIIKIVSTTCRSVKYVHCLLDPWKFSTFTPTVYLSSICSAFTIFTFKLHNLCKYMYMCKSRKNSHSAHLCQFLKFIEINKSTKVVLN